MFTAVQTHHWQHHVTDKSWEKIPSLFDNAFTNPLKSLGLAKYNVDAKYEAQMEPYITKAELKRTSEMPYPHSGFTPLTGAGGVMSKAPNPFNSANKPKAAVFVWDGVTGDGEKYHSSGQRMASIIDRLVPGLPAGQPRLVEYGNPHDAASASNSDNDYHGKVIVPYDSATGAYEVWMAAASLTEPILKST